MKTIITIVIVIGLAFLGYWYYAAPKPASNELLVSSGGIGTIDNSVGKKIITLLGQMQKITIDQSVFGAATFRSLLDFGVEIQPELMGRHDPFAPIGYEQGVTSFDTTATTSTKAPVKPKR